MTTKTNIFTSAFNRHNSVVEESMRQIMPDIKRGASILVSALRSGKKVLICGNGGSAADSQHFAGELIGRYKNNRHPLPGLALTTDTSALTAIGNDYGFEDIFKRQITALGNAGDVLVVFSTSGASKNVLSAISEAKLKKMKVIALTGERGSGLRRRAHAVVVVPTKETARIQEIHQLVYHAWCEYIDAAHV